jgi:hypothetical protein
MADNDVTYLLRIGGYEVPDDKACARLRAYWEDLTAQGRSVDAGFGTAEIALTYAAWRPEDD